MPPPSVRHSGPSIGQAIVLFLAGGMLFATTCFGMFGLEKGIPGELQGLVFLPLLFIALGMLLAVIAFVVAIVRRATATAGAEATQAAPMGRPTFVQGLGIAAAGCVLFLSLCAGVYNASNGRAGWVSGPLLLLLLLAALGGFGAMARRVWESFSSGRP